MRSTWKTAKHVKDSILIIFSSMFLALLLSQCANVSRPNKYANWQGQAEDYSTTDQIARVLTTLREIEVISSIITTSHINLRKNISVTHVFICPCHFINSPKLTFSF
jgi:hypothetical protein